VGRVLVHRRENVLVDAGGNSGEAWPSRALTIFSGTPEPSAAVADVVEPDVGKSAAACESVEPLPNDVRVNVAAVLPGEDPIRGQVIVAKEGPFLVLELGDSCHGRQPGVP
jgi:hypothetical protein